MPGEEAPRVIVQLLAFVRLGRYRFLLGGFVFYGLGLSMAYYSGAAINWSTAVIGQVIVTATQLMVHYSNDYFDLDADRVNTQPTYWSGGSRVLLSGVLPPGVAKTAAVCFGLIAVGGALGLLSIASPGALLIPMLLPAIGLSWFYSAPPLKLHSRGVGELAATLVVAVLTPFLAFYLQTRRLSLLPVEAITPLCFLQFNMLLSVNIPDAEGDARAGKCTLVVRLGPASTARVYIALLFLAYGSLPLLIRGGLPVDAALAFASPLPFAVGLIVWMANGAWNRPAAWGKLAFFTIALLMSSAMLEALAFLGIPFSEIARRLFQ